MVEHVQIIVFHDGTGSSGGTYATDLQLGAGTVRYTVVDDFQCDGPQTNYTLSLVTGKRKGAHGHGLTDVDSPAVLYWFRLTRPEGHPPHFQPYLIDSEAGVGTQMTVADVNGDGAPDILTARRSGAFVFLNQRKGTAVAPGNAGVTEKLRYRAKARDALGRRGAGAVVKRYLRGKR